MRLLSGENTLNLFNYPAILLQHQARRDTVANEIPTDIFIHLSSSCIVLHQLADESILQYLSLQKKRTDQQTNYGFSLPSILSDPRPLPLVTLYRCDGVVFRPE